MKIINKRRIGLAIFFSLITLGIYGIYWQYLLVKNCRTIAAKEGGCAGEMLCIIFVPFYSLFWWYRKGEEVRNAFSKKDCPVLGKGAVYLFLALIKMPIVAQAIMQNDFNSLPEAASKRNKKLIFCLSESAIMIALATVLSMIKVFQLPLGGSVTLLSMLPIIVISVTLGIGWGFGGAFVYSIIQLILGISSDGLLGWGLSGGQLAECIALDYIFAYTLLGIAGVFGSRKAYTPVFGTVLAMVLRFLCHFLSGYIIFANFEKFVVLGHAFIGRPALYSICYNAAYMLPELIITSAAIYALTKANFFKRIKPL